MSTNRRQFCASGAALAAGWLMAEPFAARPTSARADSPKAGEDSATLRVIAYNILKCTGWPADRPLAKRAVAKGQIAERIALELALYDPQIVTFSESPDEKLTREIAERLGMHHVRFPSGGDWPGTLLSKYEVLDSKNVPVPGSLRPDNLFTRHWGRAVLRLPNGKPLIVHSAHLYPVADPTIRLLEIDAMLGEMRDDLAAGVPMLLMGDLNHRPHGPEYPKWVEAGWVDTFVAAPRDEKSGTTAENPDGNTFSAAEPRGRIDYVWAAGPLAKRIKAARPLWEGAFRTNPADEASFALSDHVPQYAEFVLEE